MSFSLGAFYSRPEIHKDLGGGNPRSYLISVNGRIVAACLDQSLNPDAPRIILVGSGPNVVRDANRLVGQKSPISIFVKIESGKARDAHPLNWKYCGNFITDHSINIKQHIRDYEVRSGRSNLDQVIFMKPEDGDVVGKADWFFEGAFGQITSDYRERNPAARKACIDIHGCKCAVCTLDFSLRYGEIGRDFIHVHHHKPISATDGEYLVDPRHDLIPVCPNCHAMLHRRRPEPFSVDELRRVLTQRREPI